MKHDGLFITFEGPEGSGKSTQSRYLRRFLKKASIPVLLTREPGGTTLGANIRNLLLLPGRTMFSSRAELFLYLADRAQHVEEKILPFLRHGGVVISDRFTDASLAYQGFGRTLDTRKLSNLNTLATGGLVPDITFLLDVPLKEGLEAARRTSARKIGSVRGDRIEQESLAFHEKVRKGYMEIARKEPRRIRMINGRLKRKDIFERILGELNPFLQKKFGSRV